MSEGSKTKKWLTFAVRWGIAAFGVWWVVSNINFTDRVMVLDPVTGLPDYVQVLNDARDEDARFTISSDGATPREVAREDLWVQPDRKTVTLRSPDGGRQKVKLLAVKPADVRARRRVIRELLVLDPNTGRGRQVHPSQAVDGTDLSVASPFVEIGLTRMVRQADRMYLLAAVLIMPLSYLITSIRWHLLLRTLGIDLSASRTFTLNMVGAFYNAFMPGTTGGDVIKAWYAAKHTTHRTRAVLSVLIDRIIGLLALILLGGGMAAYQAVVFDDPDCERVALLSGLLIGCVALGLFVFYFRPLRRLTGLDFILRRLPMQRQVKKAVEAMEIYGRRPLAALGALLLSFPVHVITIMSATFAGLAFGLPLRPQYYWVVVPVVALVGAIPVSPQGVGVMEYFAVQLTQRHSATVSQAFILTMSIRVVQILWNLVAGVFVLRGGYHAPTDKEQEDLESDEDPAPQGNVPRVSVAGSES